jgi:hypothetical protein
MGTMASNIPSRKASPASKSSSPAARPSHDDIAARARALWESRGQPSGQDDAIWLEAETQLSPPSTTNAMLEATGRLERSDDDPTSERGAQRSARGNQARERDDDPDI